MTDHDSIPLSELLAKCEALESALLREKILVAEAISAEKPGEGVNTDVSSLAWLDYFAFLSRAHAVGARSESDTTRSEKATSIDLAMSAALAEAPEAVECSDGETRYVHPKSLWALQWLEVLDHQATIILQQIHEARQLQVVEDIGVLQFAPLMQSMPMLLWSWIVTHKGPGLPFDDEAPQIDPPAWTKSLSSDDFLKLLSAHRRVNAVRLTRIAGMLEPSSGPSRGPSFSVAGFVGAIAGELEPDAGRRMMRQISLGQIFATRVAAANAARESLRRAKEDAERNRK